MMMKARDVIAGMLFCLLLMYGPLYHEVSGGKYIRLAYLLLLPMGVFLLLNWLLYKVLHIDNEQEEFIVRLLFVLAGLYLVFQAGVSFNEDSHLYVSEIEDEGMILPGPNYVEVFFLSAFGLTSVVIAAFVGRKSE